MPKAKTNPDPKHPKPGDMHIDASDLVAVDLLPDEINKLTKLHDGYVEAGHALTSLTAAEAKTLGIDADGVHAAPGLMADIDRAGELLPAAEKLVELLRETAIERGHRLGGILHESASQARRRAERDKDAKALLAKIEPLLDYTSGPAMKGAQTKAKKAKAKAEEPK